MFHIPLVFGSKAQKCTILGAKANYFCVLFLVLKHRNVLFWVPKRTIFVYVYMLCINTAEQYFDKTVLRDKVPCTPSVVSCKKNMFRFSLDVNSERADAGRDYRSCLAKPVSQARLETESEFARSRNDSHTGLTDTSTESEFARSRNDSHTGLTDTSLNVKTRHA